MITVFFEVILIFIAVILWSFGSVGSAGLMLGAALLLGVVAIVVSSGKGGDATE